MSRTLGLAIGVLLLAPPGAATQERALSDTTSVTTVVLLTQPGDIRVEWLELVANEGARVTATREYSGVDRLSLTVTKPSISYLRFTRGTSSPITLPAKLLPADKAWRLPPPSPGGELFVTIEPATVMPERFQIVGTAMTVEPAGDPAFSVGALDEGRYVIRPLYAGGRVGTNVLVEIQRGKTTDVRWRAEPLGAADIVVDGLRCQFMDGIRVWRERDNDGSKTVLESANYPVNPKTCTWHIAGFPPGWYLMSAIAPGGRGQIMTVEIVEQKVTSVVLLEPPVRVTGQITRKGLPVADTSLMVMTAGERDVTVRTDANGAFAAALPAEGQYTLLILGTAMDTYRATFNAGDNYVDWQLAPGTIRVTVEGYAPEPTITVVVERPGTKGSRRLKPLRPGADLEFASLPLGIYVVTAVQGERRSKPIEIEVDALNDTRDVKVTLQ